MRAEQSSTTTRCPEQQQSPSPKPQHTTPAPAPTKERWTYEVLLASVELLELGALGLADDRVDARNRLAGVEDARNLGLVRARGLSNAENSELLKIRTQS